MNDTTHTAQFTFFDLGIRFSSNDRALVDAFSSMYRNFSSDRLSNKIITCYIENRNDNRNPSLIINNTVRYPLPGDGGCLGYAEMLLFRHIFEELDDCILFHAGVVEKDSLGYVILAPSGFGKTTLVLELVSRGYTFLSDEFCPIAFKDSIIQPFPRRLGIARSNAFFARVPLDKAEYLAFEKKYGIDCTVLFPGSAGTACKPAFIIQLSADLDRQQNRTQSRCVDVTLFEECKEFSDALESMSKVRVVKKITVGPYAGYRLSIQADQEAAQEFHALWQKYDKHIFGISVVPEKRPDFTARPALREVRKSAAVFDIASQVVNRLPTGKLMTRYDGKLFPLLADVGKVLSGARCFTLRPGNLSDMADLIDAIHN